MITSVCVTCVVRKVTEADNYLGLTRPLHATCNLCTNLYNAVIHMETYHHDSRYQHQCS